MTQIGIGILGGGYMGKAHAVAMSAVGAIFDTTLRPRLEMVCASSPDSAERYRAAYGFARWRFPGKNVLFGAIALTWLVPLQVVMIPNYLMMAHMGLIDTLAALILPHFASAFGIMLLAQSMRSFPDEVIEAALIDGANHVNILWEVLVPNLRGPIVSLAILMFISTWNEYFWPLLLSRTAENSVVQIGLQMFITAEGTQWGPLMAASTMASLPILLIYLVLQRQVIQSFMKSGLR